VTPARLARRLSAALTAGAAGVARAAADSPLGFGLPRDASVDGHRVDWLIGYTTIATAMMFVLVGGVLLVALARHRAGRRRADYNPGTRSSIGVLLGFVAVVAFAVDGNLFVHTLVDMERFFWNFADAEERKDTVRIEVQAHQWAWAARYAGPDGKFNTPDDVVTLNDIRVPVGAPVLIQLAAVDVIHSMNFPNFRVKRDAVPGDITKLTFTPRTAGEFEITCAQHCGPNHYKMRGVLTVLAPDGYREWLSIAEADAPRGYDPEDGDDHWGWDWRTE
jgi:cytochrome c oxidase subunit II